MKPRWHSLSIFLLFLPACNDDSSTRPPPPDTTPPAGVEDLAIAPVKGSGIELSWTAPGDDGMEGRAARYCIRYSTVPLTEARWDSATDVDSPPAPKSAGEAENFALSGLPDGTWYIGLKTADETPNWSVLSNVVTATLAAPDTIPPSRVNDLAAASVGSSSVTLSWTAPGDDSTCGWASAYDLRYALASITEETWRDATRVPAPNSAGTEETFTVTGLVSGTEYFFALRAADEVWNRPALSNVVSVTTLSDVIPPSRVSDLAAVSATTGAVTLTWTATGDDGSEGRASAYDLRYALASITEETWESATRVDDVPAPRSAGDAESFIVTGLLPVTEYFFALKAVDEAGNASEISNVVRESTVSLARLTYGPGGPPYVSAYGARWRPNGRSIAFYASWDLQDGHYVAQLYLISPGSGEPVQLTHDSEASVFPSWSPDGTRLAFVPRRSGAGKNGLWVMDAVPFAEAFLLVNVEHPERMHTVAWSSWSPDGSRIAYTLAFGWDGLPEQILVVPSAGGASQLLVDGPSNNRWPDWSPDGSQIAFVSDRSGNQDIWVIPGSGGDVTQLTFDPADDWSPAWSPDGSQIAFHSNRAGNDDIWLMSSTGENPTQLTFDPGSDSGPSWSPDGSQIAFSSDRTGYAEIWVMAVPAP